MASLSKCVAILTITLLLLAAAGQVYARTPSSSAPGAAVLGNIPKRADQATWAPDEVLVKFKSGVPTSRKQGLARVSGADRVLKEIGPRGKKDTLLLRLGSETSVQEAVKALSSRSEVVFAEPNYERQLLYAPNDPYFYWQWGLQNTGQDISGVGKPGADIGATRAWDIEQGYTNPVTVAVLDSGINFDHPDLDSKIWTNSGEIPNNSLDDDGNGYVDDVNGYNFAGISQTCYMSGAGGSLHETHRVFGTEPSTRLYAQSITGTGCALTDVGVMLSKVNSPAGNIKVSVRSDLDGPDIGHYTIAASEIGFSPTEVYRQLSSPLTLLDGVTYYLVFQTNNEDASNHYLLYENQSLSWWDMYIEGTEYLWDGAWESNPPDDFYFKTNPNQYPHDDNNHGTMVSGILAAEGNNGAGIAGVSFGAKIMPLKVTDGSGVSSASVRVDEICEALHYAADNGAKVVTMSLGGLAASQAEQDAVNYAYGKGVVLFAAVGNNGDGTVWYPAGCENVVGAGATTNQDEIAWFSNRNYSVDVTAPGLDVFTTGQEKGYYYLSGTSAASPMAAGLAALLLSRNPSLSPLQVQRAIEVSAEDLGDPGRDDSYGHGRIDAFRTLSSIAFGSTWYLAEGSTAWGFDTYITIENPNHRRCTASVIYNTSSGPHRAPDVTLPPMSQTVINPSQVVPDQDFSTAVTCMEGNIIAVDRTMIWTGQDTRCPEAHSSVGVTTPANKWYLPEGSTNWGFETWLLIQNPNRNQATCRVTYMIEGGGPREFTKDVPANSRVTYNMFEDIGSADASVKVESDLPVISERAMYRNLRREGHDSIGAISPASDYYLAEGTSAYGFTTYVLIQNPNSSACDVTITYMTPDGPKSQDPFTMQPNSRKTVRVNDTLPNTDFSTKVHGSQPIIAERAMYWDAGTGEACHDSIGIPEAYTTFYLPAGQTSEGAETWTLVQNPNSTPVLVEISYLTTLGNDNKAFTDTIPANSRKTYAMADKLPTSRAAVLIVSRTPGKRIIAERAMYWNGRGAGTSTIGGHSDWTP